MFHEDDDQTVDASVGFKIASSKITPIGFYFHSEGSLNTTLHVTESFHVGKDIALSTLLTAQYNPQSISQISASTSSKYYDQEFQNSIYALFKQHQVTVRGILNRTGNEDYNYEMDLGLDDNSLTGNTERTDGQQTTTSDIDAKKCTPTGKYYRCYKGDITVRTGKGGAGRKGTFDVSYGRGTAKLDVKVPDQIELKFDHTHTGHLRDDDFSSKTNIEGKSFGSTNKGSFSYAGSVEKEDGKWNDVQVKSSLTDKNGQKSLATDIRVNQKITNKLSGQSQRKIDFNLEQKGYPAIVWSSESNSCPNNPSNVVYGICQTTTFNIKANNQLAQRLRQRFGLPTDPKLSNPAGQATYDGTLKLDLKPDPKSGPHTMKLDLNRLKEDAVDLDVTFQPRSDDKPMNLNLKANLPQRNPISVKYDETVRTKTNFNGILKYSFDANDNSAEKTLQCDVDRPDANDVSVSCKGERTTLNLDIDRNAGKSKVYVDLNRYPGQRIGYEGVRNPQTQELDVTLYTFVSSWNIKRQPGKSTTVTVKQKNQEVLRVEGTMVGDREIQVKFSPANVNLRPPHPDDIICEQPQWDNSTVVTLKQTSPQQRNLATITVDRARIRHYLPSLRNQNRPSYDIDESASTSRKPLVEIAFDSHIFLSLSQTLDKLGSHNGLYGLDTIKKAFKLQIGDAPLTVYNIQHWKTHREDSQLPESYSVRIVNNANGNFVQLATNKWNEDRLISKISHSFDGGKTSTTDLKLDRNYAHQVGSAYFFHSLGYRNIQGGKQLRNFTQNFVRNHLMKDLNKTNIAELVQDLRKRIRSILDVDYDALKAIVAAWNKEPEKSFLRQWSTRLGLSEFFAKYPTYGQAFDRISAILHERRTEREEYWRNRIEAIVNDNRLTSLAERVQVRRTALIKDLLDRAEKLLDRLLPKVDQSNVDKRIAEYVVKLLAGFERSSKQNTEQMKAIFKAIDDASKGEDNKWFRTLVADIDSNAFGTAADAETTKVFKKLGDSSKLFISNIQQLSRGITKRREAIRERVKNAIRHIPKAFVNTTYFELLAPVGRQPGSYTGTSELMLAVGSLLRNRDQAFDTIRSVLQNRLEARSETMKGYFKALRTLAKRLFKRNPSLTPEFKAIITQSGDIIDLHGDYIYLNPACDYLLAHDFADLQFSFRFINGKVYSYIPNQGEIRDYECSNTSRVQVCNQGDYYTLNVPMYYGGRVDGALGDVRDRSGKGHDNLSRWLVRDCPAATRDQPKKGGASILECTSDDDDEQEFCENYVQNGLKTGLDKRRLIAQAIAARKQAT